MKIINIFALFQNPTGDPGWQLWDGDALIGVYRTRDQARTEARVGENRGGHQPSPLYPSDSRATAQPLAQCSQ
jgi:hypothetical protein